MIRFKVLATIVFLSAILVPHAWATHGSVVAGFGHSGPITTVSAPTPPKGSLSLQVLLEYQKFNTFTEQELLDFDAMGVGEVHNVDHLISTSIGIAYGVTDDLALHLRLPYVARYDIASVEGGDVEPHGDAKGIGDLTVLAHYRFASLPEKRLDVAALMGVKVPTGETGEKDMEGNVLEAEFQPGSGSWDPMVGLAVTKGMGSLNLDANVLYTFATEGTQDTDLGDVLAYNAALSYKALEGKASLDVVLEANGIWREREKTNGVEDINSGGNIIFLSPGLRLSWRPHSMAYLSVGFPIAQDLNGFQNDVDYRTVFGLSVGF